MRPALREQLQNEQEVRHRFYDAMHPEQEAEFINRRVIMHSPALQRHLIVTSKLVTLLTTFVESQKLGLVL